MFNFLKFKSSDPQSSAPTIAPPVRAVPFPVKPAHPLDSYLKVNRFFSLKIGEMVDAKLISREGSRAYFDLNKLGIAIIYGQEFFDAQDVLKKLQPGDTISAKVVDLGNDEGFIELSLREAGLEKSWQELKRLLHSGETFLLKVLDANRGGLILEKEGMQGFLPVSQLSAKHYPRVEGGDKEKIFVELKKFVGQTLEVKVIDVNTREVKLIFSERGTQTGEVLKLMEKYKLGDVVEGEVSGVVDFGVFVKLEEGVEGLAHISELSWNLVEDPRALFRPGQKVKAKIITIESDKISLSIKALEPDPWANIEVKYKKGDVIQGRVTKLSPYGAFVQLINENIHGLAHISEFGSQVKMQESMQVGNIYSFKITFIDSKDYRLSLAVVAGEEKENQPPSQEQQG